MNIDEQMATIRSVRRENKRFAVVPLYACFYLMSARNLELMAQTSSVVVFFDTVADAGRFVENALGAHIIYVYPVDGPAEYQRGINERAKQREQQAQLSENGSVAEAVQDWLFE